MNVQNEVYEALAKVKASINYLAPGTEQPTIHYCQPPAGTPVSTVVEDTRIVPVHDVRPLIETFSLARDGIAFIRQESLFDAFDDDAKLRRYYFPVVEQLMRDLTGAERVWTLDYAVRRREHHIANMPANAPLAGTHRRPIKLAHADFTPVRAEELMRSQTGNEAEEVLARHYLFVNFWRPIRGPLRDAPLALCLPNSVGPDDLTPIRHVYENNRRGEVLGVRYSPTHRWFYLRDMARNEAVAFISYDSARSCTQTVVPHSAFENTAETGEVLPRESYEQRIIALLP